DVPRASAGRSPPFLHEDQEAALLAAYAPHARVAAQLLAWQGCREMEALRLQLPHDVDFRVEILTFRETKNGRPRIVPMDPRVKRALKRHLGKRRVGPAILTPPGEPNHRKGKF